ncbi:hypothetical protein SH580_02340 [Coraliomargarita algicola]|uniref:PEP-CTERM protein-sorting domain-containing protein n=1 Tax=Coraliomargarita algicola TaxID=3092156 RepID=A0ABZ0RMC0_9BACT|nr:hypothetical protein [Coraliomargarita sp. J2-16]WPJ96541.1 hypothetical protein SH580_02340 [Coraliomargarita sp. J2-16]
MYQKMYIIHCLSIESYAKRMILGSVAVLLSSVFADAAVLYLGDYTDSTAKVAIAPEVSDIGSLSIDGESSISTTDRIVIGQNGFGEAFMDDEAQFVSDKFFVGQNEFGEGELTALGQSSISAVDIYVAYETGSEGTITLLEAASVSASYNLIIGNASKGSLIMGDNSQAEATASIFIGPNGSGTLEADGYASFISEQFTIASGNSGTGVVNLSENVTVTAREDVKIGVNGSAVMNLSDNVKIDATDDVYIGYSGEGEWNVTGSAIVTAGDDITLGRNSGSRGVATISDNASVSSGYFIVGDEGYGEVHVSDNATLNVSQGAYIGLFEEGSLSFFSGGTGQFDSVNLGYEGGVGTLSVDGVNTVVGVSNSIIVGWGVEDEGAVGNINLGRGGRIEIDETGLGISFALEQYDVANISFTIGDNGAGVVDSGTISTPNLGLGTVYNSYTEAFTETLGTVTLSILLDEGTALSKGDTFVLIEYGMWDGHTFDNVSNGSTLTVDDYIFMIKYDDQISDGLRAITATVIPEPTNFALWVSWGIVSLVMAGRRLNTRHVITFVVCH